MNTVAPSSSDSLVVTENAFITLNYRLGSAHGDIVNTFGEKPATLTLGSGELSPALESRLIGMQDGERKTCTLAAGEAFGEHHADKVQWVAGSLLDELNPTGDVYAIGDVVQFPTPDQLGSYAGAVVQVEQNRVLFDFNHPLAGQEVIFEAEILGIL